jgi:hypothetical protein
VAFLFGINLSPALGVLGAFPGVFGFPIIIYKIIICRQDRFIPNRNATQFDLGHFKIMNDGKTENADLLSPSQQQYQKVMSENLNGADIMSNKIISYKSKAPSVPEGKNKLSRM